MTRLLALLVVVGAVAGLGLYVVETEPVWFERIRYPLRYETIVIGHAENYGLDPALLAAVIYQESKFDADAVSSSGAVGLMQLLPETAQGIADRTGGERFRASDLRDPELNVRYGAWYLRHLIRKYRDEETALAAYNAGQTNVDGWLEEGGGIEFPETRHYVENVTRLREVYARAYAEELAPARQRPRRGGSAPRRRGWGSRSRGARAGPIVSSGTSARRALASCSSRGRCSSARSMSGERSDQRRRKSSSVRSLRNTSK